MKKFLLVFLCFSLVLACKKASKSEEKEIEKDVFSEERTEKQSDGLTLLKGLYVYHDGAAVLQTHAEIYGVLQTHNFDELNKKVDPLKTASTDMVQIEIRGKITDIKHEKILWKNKVEVVDILEVKPYSKEKNSIKITN